MTSSSSTSAPPTRIDALVSPAVHGLAIASGAAALVYEVLWTRRMTFVFGASIRAVSAVLAAYMAGLALGAFAVERRAKTTATPLRDYAIVELAIAFAGLCVAPLIDKLRVIDGWFYDRGVAAGTLTAARFALALVVIGAPASLMGTTFALLARGANADSARMSSLYAANTLGAVAGTLFAGFYAIGAFGVRRTELVAVAINTLVAAGALALARWSSQRAQTPSAEPSKDEHEEALEEAPAAFAEQPLSANAITATVFVTGAACIASEVLWSRSLAFRLSWLNNTTYTFPAMLAVVLGGVTLGSVAVGPVLRRSRAPGTTYAVILLLLGVTVAASSLVTITKGGAPFGRPLDASYELVVRRALANVLAEVAAVVALPAVLFGAAFPAAIHAVSRGEGESPTSAAAAARLYAASTAGAIVGSIGAAFGLVRAFGIVRSLVVVGALVALVGVVALRRTARAAGAKARLGSLVAVASIALIAWKLPGRPLLVADDAPTVFYEEGPTATVTVARAEDGYLRIDVDGVPVAGTSPTMLTDQKSLAHYPMVLVDRPRSALTVGFGSGGTSHSLLLHRELDRVRAVEIAPEVLHGAPHLTASNHGVLTRGDPRYGVVLDDARSYLAHTNSRYDIIATDCTDLRYRSNANLYDVEYFRFVRSRLEPGGVVAVWLPVGGLSRLMFKVALRTFGEVFRDFVVFWPNGFPSHYVVLVGFEGRRSLRWELFRSRLASTQVREDLREVSLEDPVKILSTLMSDARSLRRALEGVPLNTEDRPVLEFDAPLTGYSPRATTENLEFLADHRAAPETLVEGELTGPDRERLRRMHAALATVIAAHGASFAGETLRSMRLYLDALAIAPDDASVAARVREVATALAPRRDEPWVALTACRAEQLAGDRLRAAECYARRSRTSDEEIESSAARWHAELGPAPSGAN